MRAGTIQRLIFASAPAPPNLSGAKKVICSSGSQLPKLKSWLTMRVPGCRSASSFGRSIRISSGNRYMLTTVALRRSASNTFCREKLTRSPTPERFASELASSTSSGLMSTPNPRAPCRRAAVVTMRPSPEPRSTTTSDLPTPAIFAIASATLCGLGT